MTFEREQKEKPPGVDEARRAYHESQLWFRFLMNEGGKIYETLPKEDAEQFWNEEVRPRLDAAKNAKHEAAKIFVAALEAEYAQGENKLAVPGVYVLTATYQGRSGIKSCNGRVRVPEGADWTLANLHMTARSEISMIGIHNFGFAADEDGMGEVRYRLEGPTVIESRCLVQAGSGHIMSKYLLEMDNR